MLSIVPLLLVSLGMANTYLFPLLTVYAIAVVLIAGFLGLVGRDVRRLLTVAERNNECLSAGFNKIQRELSASRLRLAMEKSNGTLLGVLFDILVTDDFANARLLGFGLDVHRAEKAQHDQEIGLETIDESDEAFQVAEAYWQELCDKTQKKRQLLKTMFALLHGTRGDRLQYSSSEEYVRVHDQPESDEVSAPSASRSIVDITGDLNLPGKQAEVGKSSGPEWESTPLSNLQVNLEG